MRISRKYPAFLLLTTLLTAGGIFGALLSVLRASIEREIKKHGAATVESFASTNSLLLLSYPTEPGNSRFRLQSNLNALAKNPDVLNAQLADNLWEHGTLGNGQTPTAYRPPLYPLLLVPCMALGTGNWWAIALLHLVLAAMTVWLVVRLAVRWGFGRLALLAGALVACDPILSAQSAQIMTETPATLLEPS